MVREIMVRMKPLLEERIKANVFLKAGNDDTIIVYLYFADMPRLVLTIYEVSERILMGNTSEDFVALVVHQTTRIIMGKFLK